MMNNAEKKAQTRQARANYDFELGMLGYFERLENIEPREIPTYLKGIDSGFIEAIHEIDQRKFENEIDRVIQFLHSVKFYLKAHNFLIDKIKQLGGVIQNQEYDVIYFGGE